MYSIPSGWRFVDLWLNDYKSLRVQSMLTAVNLNRQWFLVYGRTEIIHILWCWLPADLIPRRGKHGVIKPQNCMFVEFRSYCYSLIVAFMLLTCQPLSFLHAITKYIFCVSFVAWWKTNKLKMIRSHSVALYTAVVFCFIKISY